MAEHNLQSVAFPTLDETQIADWPAAPAPRSSCIGTGRSSSRSATATSSSSSSSRARSRSWTTPATTPKTVTVHGPGEFTGDVSHLTGGPAIVSAVARGDCEVYEVSGEALRRAPEPVPGPRRHHPAGVHRPPAAPARVAATSPACA